MRVLVEGTVDRSIVLFGADTDPGPELTWARGVTLLAADAAGAGPPDDRPPDDAPPDDAPPDDGPPDDGPPDDGLPDGPVAVVGWSVAGLDALAFAARNAHVVDRVALIATPIPGDDRPAPSIPAKTLLLFGDKDPLTGSRHGTWWQRALPDARLEMQPGGGHDLLVPTWKRVLSHCAPRCRR
jgi:hypothetical protein